MRAGTAEASRSFSNASAAQRRSTWTSSFSTSVRAGTAEASPNSPNASAAERRTLVSSFFKRAMWYAMCVLSMWDSLLATSVPLWNKLAGRPKIPADSAALRETYFFSAEVGCVRQPPGNRLRQASPGDTQSSCFCLGVWKS